MRIGDKIKIINYGRPDDGDLIEWADEQPKNEFIVIDIDLENQVFHIQDCMYAIPIDSIDYKKIKSR